MEILICGVYHLRSSSDLITHEEYKSILQLKCEADEVMDKLIKFQPNAIAVEVDINKQTELDKLYQSFNNDENVQISEIDLLAFPLARKLGHSKVFAIDDMYSREDNPGIGGVMEYAEKYEPILYRELNEKMKEIPRYSEQSTILDKLKINAEATSEKRDSMITLISKVGVNSNLYGAKWLEWWYRRNAIIAGRLASLADKHERVLMFVGYSHTRVLSNMLSDMGKYTVLDIENYLYE